jgi:hypothetical protein
VLCVRPLSTPVLAGENNFPHEKDNKADYGTDIFHGTSIARKFLKTVATAAQLVKQNHSASVQHSPIPTDAGFQSIRWL